MGIPPRIGNDEPELRNRSANAEEEDGKRKNEGGINMGWQGSNTPIHALRR